MQMAERVRRRATGCTPTVDGRSAARVVRRVKETYLPIASWLDEEA